MRFDLAVAAVALVAGVVFIVAIPPLGGFDEPVHFLRAWQVSDGRVLPRYGTDADGTPDQFALVPASLPAELRVVLRDGLVNAPHAGHVYSHLGDPAPHGPRRWEGLDGTAYSPVPYVPAALAIRLGRALGLSTLALIELARLAQVVAYAAIVGLAIRRIDYRRPVLAVLALAPVALIQMVAVSADSLTIALTFLVIAEGLRLQARPSEEIGIAVLAEAAVAVVALALGKPPYLLVCAFFLLPMWRHRGRTAAALGAALAVGGGLSLAWNQWSENHYVTQNGINTAAGNRFYAFHNVAPQDQFGYVRAHPFRFLSVIGRTVAHYPGQLFHDAFAQSPAWQPPGAMVVCVLVLLAAALLASSGRLPGGATMRLLGVGVAGAMFVSLMFLAYVGWNAVTAPRIDAFQGRYLLPVAAVIAIVVIPDLDRSGSERAWRVILAGSGLLAFWVAVGMARLFYF